MQRLGVTWNGFCYISNCWKVPPYQKYSSRKILHAAQRKSHFGMVLSCKSAAYFQNKFLQEHHRGGSAPYSELIKILAILWFTVVFNGLLTVFVNLRTERWISRNKYFAERQSILQNCLYCQLWAVNVA